MEFQYFGANCIKISTKKATIIVDDNLKNLGLKTLVRGQDIHLRTNINIPQHPAIFEASMPGEYEITGVSIKGVSAKAYGEESINSAVVYIIQSDDLKVLVTGHIQPELTDEQLESIGIVDVMFVPVGGFGFTSDGIGALKLIKKVEPKVVIPTHYADSAITYEVPQAELSDAIISLGMEPTDTIAKYKPKVLELSDTTKLVILEKEK